MNSAARDGTAQRDGMQESGAAHQNDNRGRGITISRHHVFFTTPLIIAVVGLIGTGVGAGLQGFWNYMLERHKFEYSLVQKALSAPTQKESAQSLKFLLKSGLLRGLNESNLTVAAEEEKSLPVFLGSAIRDKYLSIQQVKAALSSLGLYQGSTDTDVVDLKFRIAVMKFQERYQLEIDGYVGPKTVLKLWEECKQCQGVLEGVVLPAQQ